MAFLERLSLVRADEAIAYFLEWECMALKFGADSASWQIKTGIASI